jgi:hypothetical protein
MTKGARAGFRPLAVPFVFSNVYLLAAWSLQDAPAALCERVVAAMVRLWVVNTDLDWLR